MESEKLSAFFRVAAEDNRISTSHVSLYAALLELNTQTGEANYFAVSRRALMKTAKISGLATYHKCIRNLAEYGYINYFPSHSSLVQSHVGLRSLCK